MWLNHMTSVYPPALPDAKKVFMIHLGMTQTGRKAVLTVTY